MSQEAWQERHQMLMHGLAVVKHVCGNDRVALERSRRPRHHIPARSSNLTRSSNLNLVATDTNWGKLRLVTHDLISTPNGCLRCGQSRNQSELAMSQHVCTSYAVPPWTVRAASSVTTRLKRSPSKIPSWVSNSAPQGSRSQCTVGAG
jgi:hypothetical protein